MRRHDGLLISIALVGILLGTLASATYAAPNQAAFEQAATELNEAVLELDPERLMKLRERFEEFAQAGIERDQALLAQGLALQASLFTPQFSGPSVGADEVRRRMRLAKEKLQGALELDPDLPGARPLLAMTAWTLGIFGEDEEEKAQADALLAATLGAALEDDPANAPARLVQLTDQMRRGQLGMAEAAEVFGDVVADLPGRRHDDGGLAAVDHWWTVFGYVALSQFTQATQGASRALATVQEGQRKVGASAALAVLAEQFRGMLGASPTPPPKGLAWSHLADDEAGDGSDEALADAASFSWALEQGAGVVWFRLRLHEPIEGDAFGANIVVDADDDPESGPSWWGGNNAFRWDLLLTAWMQQDDNGAWSGRLGASDPGSVRQGDFAAVMAGQVLFALGDDGATIYVGAPRSLFGDAESIRVVGAVGSNAAWNDDVPNEGAATITFPG